MLETTLEWTKDECSFSIPKLIAPRRLRASSFIVTASKASFRLTQAQHPESLLVYIQIERGRRGGRGKQKKRVELDLARSILLVRRKSYDMYQCTRGGHDGHCHR